MVRWGIWGDAMLGCRNCLVNSLTTCKTTVVASYWKAQTI